MHAVHQVGLGSLQTILSRRRGTRCQPQAVGRAVPGLRDHVSPRQGSASAGACPDTAWLGAFGFQCPPEPRRIPSAKWRELIKKVWEADPLLCPKCSREMCIVALIDDREVIERILCHLGLWVQGVRVFPARAPPEPDEWVIESCYDDPFPCLPRRSEDGTTTPNRLWRRRTAEPSRQERSAAQR